MKSPFIKYISAEINNAINGAVINKDAKARLDTCMACEFRAVEYKGVKDPRGVGFCAGGCGCGATGRAQLETKVTIAGATCPKSKWKINPPTQGASINSIWESTKGIVKTAIEFAIQKKPVQNVNSDSQTEFVSFDEHVGDILKRINTLREKHGFPNLTIDDLEITNSTQKQQPLRKNNGIKHQQL